MEQCCRPCPQKSVLPLLGMLHIVYSAHLLSHLLLFLLEPLGNSLAEAHELLNTPPDALLFWTLEGLGAKTCHTFIETSLDEIVVSVHGLLHLHVIQLRHHLQLVPLRQAI